MKSSKNIILIVIAIIIIIGIFMINYFYFDQEYPEVHKKTEKTMQKLKPTVSVNRNNTLKIRAKYVNKSSSLQDAQHEKFNPADFQKKLRNSPWEQLIEEWKNMISDPSLKWGYIGAFTQKMLKESNTEQIEYLYKYLSEKLNNIDGDKISSYAALAILENLATPKSTVILFNALKQNNLLVNKDSIRESLINITRTYVNGMKNFKVSPIFEEQWLSIGENIDKADMEVIAEGISNIGTNSGISLLIKSVFTEKGRSIKRQVALQAIANTNSPDAVEPLSQALDALEAINNSLSQKEELEITFLSALTRIRTIDALETTVNYLEKHPITHDKLENLIKLAKQIGMYNILNKKIGLMLKKTDLPTQVVEYLNGNN